MESVCNREKLGVELNFCHVDGLTRRVSEDRVKNEEVISFALPVPCTCLGSLVSIGWRSNSKWLRNPLEPAKVAPIFLRTTKRQRRLASNSLLQQFRTFETADAVQSRHLHEFAARVNAERKDYFAKVETLISEWRQATGGGSVPPELVEKQKILGKALSSFDIPGEIVSILDPDQARDLLRTTSVSS